MLSGLLPVLTLLPALGYRLWLWREWRKADAEMFAYEIRTYGLDTA